METPSIEDLQKENDDLKTELEMTKEVNQELTAKIEELSKTAPLGEAGERAQAEETPVIPTSTFEVGGKNFKFITPVFVYGGKRVLASQAINDTALLTELVDKGVGVITLA